MIVDICKLYEFEAALNYTAVFFCFVFLRICCDEIIYLLKTFFRVCLRYLKLLNIVFVDYYQIFKTCASIIYFLQMQFSFEMSVKFCFWRLFCHQ